jgi:type II secretory ATPase GspE/PulE/Tfp pilus assembly ATPase PilB-like protein
METHSPSETEAAESSAPKILEELVQRAERAAASDIHLQMLGKTAQVAFRLDGVMTAASELPEFIAERVFGRIKFLARLKTYQELLPQDGRIDKSALKSRNDIRVATYPTVTGEKIVLRLFTQEQIRRVNELELPAEACDAVESVLRRTSGLLLLTGPAGSGKTTTIYGCLSYLAGLGGRHIITVEDPAEQIIPGVMQTEVSEARGLTFPIAARHLLRQDPQVLVIGEIRDDETANIAVRAALTGHLVISTLHAGSCRGVFERLQVLCADHSAVASAVELVLNQRLVRRVCRQCEGSGCLACLQTGYQGRLPAVEWLKVDDAVRDAIRQRELHELRPRSSLEDAIERLVRSGITNEGEQERILGRAGGAHTTKS